MAVRSNLHGKSQIIAGDRTSHGGVVLSGSPTNFWHDIPVARKTDKVYCPRCKPHLFEIAEGLANSLDGDACLPMAAEGHATSCGATLIAEGASATAMQDALHFFRGTGYDDHFVLRDAAGDPMRNTYYAIRKPGGEPEYGTTDEAGHTHLVLSGPEAAQIHVYVAG